ncbi:MAG: hypothetical protein ACW97Z_02405 [Candidatus Hodarchaeales archaeon]|jgi:hypothetical protein
MSGSTDWIHGLLTVGIWFGIIILYAFLIKKRKNLSLKVALGAISLIVMNFLLINFDIQIKEFLILPLGLLLFLLAALILVIQFFYRRRKQSRTTTMTI